jgi:predicted phage terminase large subunit-like protein
LSRAAEDKLRRIAQNPYIPHLPTPKQLALLLAPELEVLWGGSAGGGKSDGLLMAALEYVDVPGYTALLLRRTYADLSLPGALMDRAHQWLRGTDAHWSDQKKTYTFPSGATLTFGYLQTDADKFRYQGSELCFIGWDELTQFPETSYRYLFSRLRKPANVEVPLRLRSASNPGGVGHCVPYGDVLTPAGWKDIRDVAMGDPVYTVRADGFMAESRVEQVHREHYRGDLVQVRARGLRMTCTPNHGVAKVGGRRDAAWTPKSARRFSLTPFEQLPGQATVLRSVRWAGTPLPEFRPEPVTTRRRKLAQPRSLPGRSFASLLGWMLAEGFCVERDKSIGISQSKPEHRERLRRLLEDECGFKARWQATFVTVSAPDWWGYFRRFGWCREKYIPEWIKAGSAEDLQALLSALVDGDGHWTTRGQSGQFYTTSKRLADDFAEIALKLGYLVYASKRQRENRDGLSHCVSFKRTRSGGTEILTGQHVYQVSTHTQKRSDVERVPYEGDVFCIGVPDTHSFVIRQEGSVWVSGNSWVKQRFIEEGNPAQGRRFIPAGLVDNPFLDRAEYERSLMELDPFTRAQLLKGDWSAARPYAKFRRHWFEVVDAVPAQLNRVRFWDLASTEPAHGKDPDWTAGCLMGQSLEGIFYVLDMRHTQASPKGITDLIVQTAALDGKAVDIWIEQEPGSNSDFAMAGFRQQLMAYSFHPLRATGDKEVRANPLSSQAEAGNVKLLRGPWITGFLDEHEAFPSDGEHDDRVDATSGAYGVLADPANAQAWIAHMERRARAQAEKGYVPGAGVAPPEELQSHDPDGWAAYMAKKSKAA